MQGGNIERRKHPRLDKSLPVKVLGDTFDFVTDTVNISSGGVLCNLDKPIPIMTKLKIALMLPDISGKGASRIDCEGIVIRTEEHTKEIGNKRYAFAIVFSDIKDEDKAKISRYVASYLMGLH